MPQNKESIKQILKDAKLSSYEEKFMSYGADDPQQIALFSKLAFENLIKHVGMASKPLHVTRLLGTLQQRFGIAPEYMLPDLPDKNTLIYQGQPEFISSGNNSLFEHHPKKRKMNPYYGEIVLPPDNIFDDLTDKRSDNETHKLIESLSVIYTKEPLTKYQQTINACALQLCLRDTTLLARRSELATRAREANRLGGTYKFQRGYSLSKHAPKEIHVSNSATNFVLANKHREERLQRIQVIEKKLEKFTLEKESLLVRLKHQSNRDNKVGIGVVRSRLNDLEEQIYIAKSDLKKLKESQKRSERYFIAKLQPKDLDQTPGGDTTSSASEGTTKAANHDTNRDIFTGMQCSLDMLSEKSALDTYTNPNKNDILNDVFTTAISTAEENTEQHFNISNIDSVTNYESV